MFSPSMQTHEDAKIEGQATDMWMVVMTRRRTRSFGGRPNGFPYSTKGYRQLSIRQWKLRSQTYAFCSIAITNALFSQFRLGRLHASTWSLQERRSVVCWPMGTAPIVLRLASDNTEQRHQALFSRLPHERIFRCLAPLQPSYNGLEDTTSIDSQTRAFFGTSSSHCATNNSIHSIEYA
jgi:hypothetical protein